MKISLNWLKEYVDITDAPEALAEKLTRAGVPVEYLEYPGEGIIDVVTGQVVDICRHPEADKLWICQMDVKKEEILQIVTGADNVVKGAVVPVAQVGSVLPDGRKMKKAKLRGVDSAGMLCSASELGIADKLLQPEERDGIFILPAGTPLGVDVREVLGLNDVVFEIELTANRGDCLSVIGIAREVAAVTGQKLKLPQVSLKEEGPQISPVEIKIADSKLSPRFTARILTDINIAPSPLWLQNRLRLSDMRPLNNVVDATNYVMLELGQPTHAYDKDTLQGNIIMTRPAVAGEKLLTLDGSERALAADMIVIADGEKAVGLAGVMGGLNTEISPGTKTVLLEAACFDPETTRKTSRALGLRSEASNRFEHGIDRDNVIVALDRLAGLLEELGAAKVCPNRMDNYPAPAGKKVITTTAGAINSRLGTAISAEKMGYILTSLGFSVERKAEDLAVGVPGWRNDVTIAADISEEIARINGYDNIPGALPFGAVMQGRQSKLATLIDKTGDFLCAAGLNEIIGYSFTNPGQIDKLNLAEGDALKQAIPVLNPITDEFSVMRTTLLTSVLGVMQHNVAHRNEDVAIFEIGRTYQAKKLPLDGFPVEETCLVAAVTGKRWVNDWNQGKEDMDFYDIKGLTEELFDKLNISGYQIAAGTAPYLHPGKSAAVAYRGENIGLIGEVHPQVAAAFDLAKPAYVLVLKLSPLIEDAGKIAKYQRLPRYPEIFRDLSMLAPVAVSNQDIEEAIRGSAGKLLRSVRLFDLYTGKQVEAGMKSMAYALSFQAEDRTLTDEDVDKAIKCIVATLEEKLAIKLRG